MAEQWSDLFKWKRRTNPKSHFSRGNVQDWIKRVQRESDAAAKEVFGNDYCGLLEQVHVDDDALVEAQDLLDSWINDKKLEDLRVEAEFSDERWAHSSTRRHLAKELLGGDGDTGIYNICGDGSLGFKDHLHESFSRPHAVDDFEEELDEDIALQNVIRNMLDKKVVEQHITSDLGFDELKKRRDPLTKMELRHKQVKEKSDSRRKEKERSKREKSARKEAEYLARQQLLREEKERQARVKKEEADIQKEMARIRRTMKDERKFNREQEQREQQKLEEAESLARQYLEQEERKKEEKKRLEQEAKEEIRRQLLREMEEKAVREAREDKRIMKKYFSAWYSVVVSQRIKLGKGRAMADWRCKLRAWNAWRTFVRHVRSDKEAQAIQLEMKEKHRKERLAANFHRHHLLRRCFHGWQRWVHHEQEHRQLMDEHRKKAGKMSALLRAAASGKLWSKHGGEDGAGSCNDLRLQDIEDVDGIRVPEGSRDESRANTARRVDDLFCEPRRQARQKAKLSAGGEPKGVVSPSQSTSYESTNAPRHTQQAWASQEKNNALKDRTHSHRSQPKQSKQKTTNIALEKQRTYKQVDNIESLYSPDGGQSPKIRSHRQRMYSEVESVENLHSRATNGNITPNERKADKKKELRRFLSEEKLNRKTETAADNVRTGTHAPDWFDSGGTSARSAASSRLVSRAPVVKSAKVATKPLHLAMEERAKERAERKAVLENKRRRAEEEKLAQLKLQQEQQELELLKEKQEILRKKREEKRIMKERELEKQQRMESMRKQNASAEQHYNRTLLRKYGLSPWKRLVTMTTENMSRTLDHHNRSLVRGCFYPWLEYTQKQTEQREKAADLLNRWILLRRYWTSWRKYGQHMVRLDSVAEKYCATYLKRKYLRLWLNYVTDEQIMYWEKERRADNHNEWRIKKQALIYWKKLIPLVRGEKEKEKRRDEMRRRVQSWLPDFKKSQYPSP